LSFETATVPVPDAPPPRGFDPLWYVVAQPLGTIIRAVSKLGSVWGKRCAVLGCGQNGLLMTALLSRMGARVLVALDLFENRVAAARLMGATHAAVVPASPDTS
jgi:threonine dehydrogenase-like Zn-dependent dehydrogenase